MPSSLPTSSLTLSLFKHSSFFIFLFFVVCFLRRETQKSSRDFVFWSLLFCFFLVVVRDRDINIERERERECQLTKTRTLVSTVSKTRFVLFLIFPNQVFFFFSLFLLLRLFDLWENKGHAENEVERNYRLSILDFSFGILELQKVSAFSSSIPSA